MPTDSLLCERYVRFSLSEYVQNGDYITSGMEKRELAKSRGAQFSSSGHRIYRASQRGDAQTVRRLQKSLAQSWSAKLIAVRRVTQDNKGRATAGVDGIKSLTPPARLVLAKNLKLDGKSSPISLRFGFLNLESRKNEDSESQQLKKEPNKRYSKWH